MNDSLLGTHENPAQTWRIGSATDARRTFDLLAVVKDGVCLGFSIEPEQTMRARELRPFLLFDTLSPAMSGVLRRPARLTFYSGFRADWFSDCLCPCCGEQVVTDNATGAVWH